MLRVYIGWDERDVLAYEVCRASLLAHASIPVEIVPLKHWELRRRGLYRRAYWCDESGQKWDARDENPFSTGFSFTRFLVPALEQFKSGWVLFCDPDMLWRADVAELLALAEDDKAVMVVQHRHAPTEKVKMGGLLQTAYNRKNWSSLMLMQPQENALLTPYVVNLWKGHELHGFRWLSDAQIGSLPVAWNWLAGASDPAVEPKIVHYTAGTPDMPEVQRCRFDDEWWGYARRLAAA